MMEEGFGGFGPQHLPRDAVMELWKVGLRCMEEVLKGKYCEDPGLEKAVKAGLGQLLEAWMFKKIETEVIGPTAEMFLKRLDEGSLEEALEVAARTYKPLAAMCAKFDALCDKCRGPEDEMGSTDAPERNSSSGRLKTTFENALILGDLRWLRRFRELVRSFLEKQFRLNHRFQIKKLKASRSFRRTGSELLDEEDGYTGAGSGASENEDEDDDFEDENEEDSGEDEDDESAFSFDTFSAYVSSLGWFPFFEEPLSDILCQLTEKHLIKVCKGRFEFHLLGKICSWLESVALGWLRNILAACIKESVDQEANLVQREKFEQWKARLEFHVFETLCDLRMSELFDIITEFPESGPALDDLKDSLARTHQYKELVQSLRYSFASRLLHPGANTAQILDVYISTIKALRLLDPSGVLLEAISEPIKRYLRKREDTVRCIVTSLTDDSNSELFEELGRSGEIQPIAQDYDESDDEGELDDAAELAHAQDWTPDPIEADPRKTSRSRQSSDILSILVHIYGSKELFVNEYRLMLANKLLSSLTFDTEREVRNLELLKLRFGEGSMLNCEIMIKDIEDSKRINTNIHNTLRGRDGERNGNDTSLESLEVTIVSKQFWPTLHGEDINLHPLVAERMKTIAHEYSVLKNPRQLVWKSNLGSVQLELEFDDGQTKSFTVQPILANLIMHFGDKETWPSSELASVAGLSEEDLKKRMSYWVNQGVVRVKKDSNFRLVYHSVETLSEEHEAGEVQDDEAAEGGVSADAQLAEEMKVYEVFVRGMLNNYESLPLERIHNMLKMFVSTGEHKYDKNMQQLRAFLDKLIQEEVLEISGGNYCLRKK